MNWRSSVAVVITTKVVLVIAVLITTIATLVFVRVDDSLLAEYEEKADLLAYRIEKVLIAERSVMTPGFERQARVLLVELGFVALRLTPGAGAREIGQFRPDLELKLRRILVNESSGIQTITLVAAHIPLSSLAHERHKQVFYYSLASLALLSLLLLLTIRRNVLQPLAELVQTTRRAFPGQGQQRIDSRRKDEFGQLSRFFDAMLDQILQRQSQLEVALGKSQAANIAKNRFLANMSHELRTPLNAIIGYGDMLYDSLAAADRPTDRDDCRQITTAAWHLLSLIDQILDLTMIEAGSMSVNAETLLIGNLVDDLRSTFATPLASQGNALRINIADDCVELVTDHRKLRQILVLLLNNANKFTQQGMITLSIRSKVGADKTQYEFAVSDSGIGIAPENLPLLFQPFYQSDDSPSRSYGGTGLGLALCKQLCLLLGGDISVRSERGRGSSFTVSLPARPPAATGG